MALGQRVVCKWKGFEESQESARAAHRAREAQREAQRVSQRDAGILIHTFSIQPNIDFEPNKGIRIPKMQETQATPAKPKPTTPPVWAWDVGPSPSLPGPCPN